jgi:hypothetical protein
LTVLNDKLDFPGKELPHFPEPGSLAKAVHMLTTSRQAATGWRLCDRVSGAEDAERPRGQ